MGLYIRLTEFDSQEAKRKAFFDRGNYYYSSSERFLRLPGVPIAYWVKDSLLDVFQNKKLVDYANCCTGMQTGNNQKYVRLWQEIDYTRTSIFNQTDAAYEKYNCGGENRRWYGNNYYLVLWEKTGQRIRNEKSSVIRNEKFFFKSGITWKRIGGSQICLRLLPEGYIFDQAGDSMFTADKRLQFYLLGLLNSIVATRVFEFIAPTLNLTAGNMNRIPIIYNPGDSQNNQIYQMVQECIDIAKEEWDAFELSWDYSGHPLQPEEHEMGVLIENKYNEWEKKCDDRFRRLKNNEEELNRLFIDIYGLSDELSPTIQNDNITLRKADLRREIKSLISYAVGCMFGRYSLDQKGLVYAGGEWNKSQYRTFLPDEDNVLPITDEEYLEDDIVSRFIQWVKTVYGDDTLERNLDYIAHALGNKGNSSREVIRNYFLSDFFRDHCDAYSVAGSGKRPIYWLFDSGKENGLKALIYLHRYNADTIGNLRIDYLHRMQRIYESEISRMQDMIDHSTSGREVAQATKRREKLTKQLKECREYDEKLAHLALSRIELDLDDGVKKNYRKIQTANDGKFYEVLADSKNIMSKE